MNILLFGCNGLVGNELQKRLPNLGTLNAVGRKDANFCDKDSIIHVLESIRPEIIVNAAAYTDVDGAEKNFETAFLINAIAPEVIANWASKNRSAIVHFSTDYVFDGSGERPWTEDDTPRPINRYGETKLAGDLAILKAGVPCLVIRTSWIYAFHGNSFLSAILKLAEKKDKIRVVADQFGAPTSAEVLAETTYRMLMQQKGQLGLFLSQCGGLINVATSGETSWHGFASQICKLARANGKNLRVKQIEAIPTALYPLPAPRPQNSRLDLNRLTKIHNLIMPGWLTPLECGLKKVFEHTL